MEDQPLRFGICIAVLLSIGHAHAADVIEVRKQRQINQRIENSQNLRDAFGLSGQEELAVATARVDQRGVSHTRYRQKFRGVPVWGEAVVISRTRLGNVRHVHGRLVRNLARDLADTTPDLTADDALNAMKVLVQPRRASEAASIYRNESAELVIYLDGELPLLSYAVSFFVDIAGGGDPGRPVFIVDAHNGRVLFEYDGLTHIETGTGPGGNEKTGLYRYDGTTGNFGKLDVQVDGAICTMNNPNVKTVDLNHGTTGTTAFSYACPENTHKQINRAYSPLNDAHYFGDIVFDMYSDWMASAPLVFQLTMRVHYSNGYDNAFWDGSSMTFGDGDTKFYPLVSLDVSAHEVSHGFTEQNSDLIYSGQSGGINESFSDIAGEAAEFYSRGSADFLIGANITKQTPALRYMADPTQDGLSIGHASGYYSEMDVHYSSGVFNKAFYLLANTSNWDVHKAFVLFATANRDIWTPSETFDTAYAGLVLAYEYLLTADGVPDYSATDVTDVEAAFAQVGVPRLPPGPVCEANPPALSNGIPTSSFSGTIGEWQCWKLTVPDNATNLKVTLRNRVKGRYKYGGDADLYIKHGSSPLVDPNPLPGEVPAGDYDCGSYTPDSDEECSIPDSNNPQPPAAGDWHIAVFAWSDFPAVDLTGAYTLSGGSSPSGGIDLSATEKGGRNKRFVNLSWSGANGESIEIIRNGLLWLTTANDGSHKDDTGVAGLIYQICEVGTTTCSEEVTVQ